MISVGLVGLGAIPWLSAQRVVLLGSEDSLGCLESKLGWLFARKKILTSLSNVFLYVLETSLRTVTF